MTVVLSIENLSDRNLDKAQITRLSDCGYISERHDSYTIIIECKGVKDDA